MSKIILPTNRQIIACQPGRLTRHGKRWFENADRLLRKYPHGLPRIAGASGTLSNFAETSFLDHLGKTAYTSPSTYLGLLTVVPDSSKTGATVTEANYTGYARYQILAAGWNSAVSGGAGGQSTKSNNGTISMAGCTGGSSTVIAWALFDVVTLATGNMLAWGTCTSVVISTTQTPPTIASGGLVLGLT